MITGNGWNRGRTRYSVLPLEDIRDLQSYESLAAFDMDDARIEQLEDEAEEEALAEMDYE